MSTTSILIERIQKSFGSRRVLNHVSLSVPEGKTTALLGRNGAGKTTLIRILLGLLPADSGRVQMLGIDPTIDPLRLRSQIGYLAEDQTMYPWMTPIELCRFLAPFYPTWEMKVANDYLDRFSIPHHGRIHNLSKGQSVKLGLVLALAHRPISPALWFWTKFLVGLVVVFVAGLVASFFARPFLPILRWPSTGYVRFRAPVNSLS